jgi:ATP-dependent protease ClpP protease subunit
MNKWYAMKASADGEAEICIFSEIGGWGISAAQFDRDLKALGNVKTLNVKINSPGGSVIEGTMIFNLLVAHAARKVVDVLGWAASMASVIAMAGDVVRMPANTYMMIHNPWMSTSGDAEQLRKDADLLDKMRTGLMTAYKRKARNLSDKELTDLLDAETWMTAAEAKAYGFADEVTGEIAAAAKVDPKNITMFGVTKIPDAAAKWMADNTEEETTDEGGKTTDTEGGTPAEPDKPEQDGNGSGTPAATVPTVAIGEIQPPASGSGVEAANLVTALNIKCDALKAEAEAIKTEAARDEALLKGQIAAAMATIAKKDAEIASLKDEHAKSLNAAQGRFDKLTHDYNDLAERHSRIVSGGLSYEPDCDLWQDALAKCGNDYVEARKRHPALWAKYMDAQNRKKK